MSGMIKPIETIYNGYRFRSRLEARWAVFFDAMGFSYEYEKEGFEFEGGLRYLPDFWLPHVKMWAEVKPCKFTQDEIHKCNMLVIGTKMPCLLLVGVPSYIAYDSI